ncbi:MAG: helix-turn-helix domain-containing protein [Candidatus Methanomethylophilaceae archaeon]|nr:helix-turn-helix domain-containing protein [Candidatus Methanomethylophilaceae archaeon]
MRVAKILIDEEDGGLSCIEVLPKICNSPELGTSAEVMQCSGLIDCGGCAMIRISDPYEKLASFCSKHKSETSGIGSYTLDRVSKQQIIAIVRNNTCEVAKYVKESGCFLTSAVRSDDGRICWTVLGSDDESISVLLKTLEKEGYNVENVAKYTSEYESVLTPKQEDAVRLAFEQGYYDIPRRTDVRRLSEMAEVSRSTFDVSLRSAEKRIIANFIIGGRKLRKKRPGKIPALTV